MAQGLSPDSKVAELPTIIIDPSLYKPEQSALQKALARGVRRLTRVMLITAAVGTATIGIAHVLDVDSLSLRSHVLALTTQRLSDLTGRQALHSSPAAQIKPVDRPLAAAAPIEVVSLVPEPIAPIPEPALAVAEESEPAAQVTLLAQPAAAAVELAKPVLKPLIDIQEATRNARRLLSSNRVEEAEAAYRRVLAFSKNQPAALVGLARILLARGELDEALALAQRAAEKAPDQASSHLALGDVLQARGDSAAAQAQYAQATQRSATKASSEPAPSAE